MQFQKNLITIAAALAFGAASTTLFAAPITTEGVGVGKHGDIRVAVTFDNGKIQKIDILKNAENPVLSKKSFHGFKGSGRCRQLRAGRHRLGRHFHVERYARRH